MLTHLQIRDFAIVEQLELDFAGGLSIISGETGAGKSIMVDALGLLLGDRADSGLIRHGAERAEIAASFDLRDLADARDWLQEHDLDADECHLRRVIAAQGRSRCYVNGASQPLAALRDLGDRLVDIHSQHEHQSLLRREVQRQLLDDYAGHRALLIEVEADFRRWQTLQRELADLDRAGAERDARLDLLRFQIDELAALEPTADEPDRLADEQRRLANASRLIDGSRQSLMALYEDDEQSAHALVSRVENELDALLDLDSRLQAALQLVASARIQLEEAGSALRHYSTDLELDPERLQSVEQRLDSYYGLSRKHRCQPAELAERLERLNSELEGLDNSEQHRERLSREVEQARSAFMAQARRLGAQRAAAARRLSEQVSATMQELGMQGGRFDIALEPLETPTAYGLEGVAFQVSANPGQPLRALARVASGGELSRISLAIQVITADSARIPTLIFDEVDTGIGGAVAEVVGRQLRTLGLARQVLCVTHLPQVAAQGHRHYRVDKRTRGATTQTSITTLDDEQRIEEIARMLGGLKLTDRTLAHAREMIDQSART